MDIAISVNGNGGTVLLSDLKNLKLPMCMTIERDLHTGDSKYIKDFVDYLYGKEDEVDYE